MTSGSERSHGSSGRHPLRALGCACLVLAAMSGAPDAGAEPTAADKETARALMEQGLDRMQARDYAGALKAFSTADELMHVPTTALYVARAHAALQQLLEARDRALEAARFPARPGEPSAFAAARAEANDLAAALAPRIPSLEITLEGLPADATPQVTVDSRPVRAAALRSPYKLNPGSHLVQVSCPGFERRSITVLLAERQSERVTISMSPVSGGRADRSAPPDGAPRSSSRPWVYVGFGLGAAGVITGAVTGAMALSKQSALEDRCNASTHRCPSEAQGDLDAGRTLATVSSVGFGVGVVGIGVAVISLLWPEAKPARQQAALAPAPRLHSWASHQAAGLGVSGWF